MIKFYWELKVNRGSLHRLFIKLSSDYIWAAWRLIILEINVIILFIRCTWMDIFPSISMHKDNVFPIPWSIYNETPNKHSKNPIIFLQRSKYAWCLSKNNMFLFGVRWKYYFFLVFSKRRLRFTSKS